jgi:hypothetical protein
MKSGWVSIALPMLVFAIFVILALFVRKGDRPGESAPLKIFVVYVIAVSMYVGLSRNDLWPFAAWRYVSYAVGQEGSFMTLVGVDEKGNEHQLDTRTFEPLEFTSVMSAIGRRLDHPEAPPNELLNFLLKLTQDGLARAHAGQPIGRFERFLGPFSAPVFHVPVLWSDPEKLPHQIDELRVYHITWRVVGDTAHVEKRVVLASTKS